MEQQFNIKSTSSKISLIQNLPIEFSVNDRRSIQFTCPTVEDIVTSLDFGLFITIIKLDAETLKKLNIKVNFDTSSSGKIIQGLLSMTDYANVIAKFFTKYIKNSKHESYSITVDGEKVMSYEYDYMIQSFLIAIGQKEYEEKQEQIDENLNPQMAKILKAQKESEEKLKAAKKKKQSEKGLELEEILLAICYEFGFNMNDLMKITYYGVAWYFGFVGKVDAHKLNQMILSSGMSKQKHYNYWLNK
jgi:hypothetical protein